jgi:hypothetical protein
MIYILLLGLEIVMGGRIDMQKGLIRKGLVFSIIVLFIGVGITPTIGITNSLDDTTPPVTNISFYPSEPDGDNGWYIVFVDVTLEPIDDISGVNVTYYRINNGSWIVYVESFQLYESNFYTIEFYSVDNAGNQEESKNASCKLDNEPPTTIPILAPSEPDGDNGWYVSNVTVIFNASDDMSGVNITYPAPVVILTEDYSSGVDFYSVDYAGNEESHAYLELDIDQTSPDIYIAYEIVRGFPWWQDWELVLTVTSIDAISGMDRLEIYIDDELYEIITGHGPTFELIINWSSELKTTRLNFTTFDIAGNSAFVLLNGSDIKSCTRSQSITSYFGNLWFQWFFDRFPLFNLLLQREFLSC